MAVLPLSSPLRGTQKQQLSTRRTARNHGLSRSIPLSATIPLKFDLAIGFCFNGMNTPDTPQ